MLKLLECIDLLRIEGCGVKPCTVRFLAELCKVYIRAQKVVLLEYHSYFEGLCKTMLCANFMIL